MAIEFIRSSEFQHMDYRDQMNLASRIHTLAGKRGVELPSDVLRRIRAGDDGASTLQSSWLLKANKRPVEENIARSKKRKRSRRRKNAKDR